MIRYWILGVFAASLSSCNDVSEIFGGSIQHDYESALRNTEAAGAVTSSNDVEPPQIAPQTMLSATGSSDDTLKNSSASIRPEYGGPFAEHDPAKLAVLRKYKMVPVVKGNTVHDRVSVVVLREGMESSDADGKLSQVDVWRLSGEMYQEECEAGDGSSCRQAILMQNLIGCAHRDEVSCTAVRAEFQRDEENADEKTIGTQ